MYVNPFWKGIDTISLFVNSFFESSSGFTTTGISTITHPEDLPQSFSFYRSYTLWVGGLSFVYLVMSLYYPEKKLASMRNMLGAGILKFRQLVSTISIIFVFYAIILILLIYFLGINSGSIIGSSVNTNGINNNDQIKMIIDSVSIIFATLTSGGFVPVSTFLTLENIGQLIVIMAGMIIAALPFAFHYGIFSRQIKARELASEISIYIIFISLSILLFTSIEYQYLNSTISSNNETLSKDLSHSIEKGPQLIWIISAFHVISASTTTGFQFIDLSNLSVGGKIELIIIMLIGGTAFSTAGGIKIARLILIYKILKKKKPIGLKDILRSTSTSISSTPSQFANIDKSNIKYKKDNYNTQKTNSSFVNNITKSSSYFSLNDLKPPSITITNKPLREALLVIFLFVSVSILSAFAICFIANKNFIDSLFESSSAISNTGLSVGITTMNLDNISKSILSLEMILGRFEIIAVLYIFIDRLKR
jgi:trk system potassium uptake protein TrkH